jgi:hypothetical protein
MRRRQSARGGGLTVRLLRFANDKQQTTSLIMLDKLRPQESGAPKSRVWRYSVCFVQGGRPKAGEELTKQTVISLIFLDKLHTGKEKQ